MTLFFTALIASFLGQLAALWLIGWFAHRAEIKKAQAIQQAIEEAQRETAQKQEKFREYLRMET